MVWCLVVAGLCLSDAAVFAAAGAVGGSGGLDEPLVAGRRVAAGFSACLSVGLPRYHAAHGVLRATLVLQ